jgi:hypothetical protein
MKVLTSQPPNMFVVLRVIYQALFLVNYSQFCL